jgi:hypothetical protein
MTVTDDRGHAGRPPSGEIVEVVQVGRDDSARDAVHASSSSGTALAIDDRRTPS